MPEPAPNLGAYYEPRPDEAILFGWVAEFMIDPVRLARKINGVKEGWAVHEELSGVEETKPMHFIFPIDEYVIQDEGLQRTIDDIESIKPPSDRPL